MKFLKLSEHKMKLLQLKNSKNAKFFLTYKKGRYIMVGRQWSLIIHVASNKLPNVGLLDCAGGTARVHCTQHVWSDFLFFSEKPGKRRISYLFSEGSSLHA